MAMIDAKTNFMLLMSLIKISPSDMAAAIGTDATLISRWRTGKRRLIAGRPWIKKIAAYFVEQDEQSGVNCVEPIMAALYPDKPCKTYEQRIACVTQFLLCPGQQELEYRRRRFELLNRALPDQLRPPKDPHDIIDHIGEQTQGRQKLMAAVMEYFGIVAANPLDPQRMIIVSPSGLNPLLRISAAFSKRMMERICALFDQGHTLSLVVDDDYVPDGTEQFHARLEGMHLRGYMDTHYCSDFWRTNQFHHTLIMTIKRDICVSITLPDDGDLDRAVIQTVKSHVTAGKTHYMALKLRNRTPERHRQFFLEHPSSFLSDLYPPTGVHEGAVYSLGELPFFGAMTIREAARLYKLSDGERDAIEFVFWPLFLEASHVRGFMRHVLCRDEIEHALLMDDIEVPALSKMVGREVRITRAQLIYILKRIEDLLCRFDHYQVAFLPRHVMEPLGLRATLVEDVCAIGFGDGARSTATFDERRTAFLFGEYVWRRIPSGMKSHNTSLRTVRAIIQAHEEQGEE